MSLPISRRNLILRVCLVGLSCVTAFLLQACTDETQAVGAPAAVPAPAPAPAPAKGDVLYQSDIVQQWSVKAAATYNAFAQYPSLVTDVEKRPAWPVEMATVHVAMYDVLMQIHDTESKAFVVPEAIPDGNVLTGPGMEAAVSAAAYEVLKALWPDRSAVYQQFYDDTLARLKSAADAADVTKGLVLGAAVGAKVVQRRANDGRMKDFGPYATGTLPGEYRLPPVPVVSPFIANIQPFVLDSPSELRAPGPYALTDPRYATDFNETKDLGSATSALRTASQTDTARFHTEAPNVHWPRNLAQFAHFRPGTRTLLGDAQLSAVIWVSVADSIITCWESKYHYWRWRPQSAIALAATDGNDDTAADATWVPLGPVPPHPEYPAAHTCVASAVAGAVGGILGSGTAFTFDSQTVVPAVPAQSYPNVAAMLESNFMGRIWGGQHFRKSLEDSQAIGTQTAARVREWALFGRTGL